MQKMIAYIGTTEEIDSLQALVARHSLSSAATVSSDEEASLSDFVESLDKRSVAAIKLLANSPEAEFTAPEAADSLGILERDFYGFIGVIGRAWKKWFPMTPNPFRSHWSDRKRAPVWSISTQLAARLLR